MGADDLREMLAGSLGGAAATIIEYPMDTIKVRLQDGGKHYDGVWHCIQHIAKGEGLVNGFFRGLPAPVLGAAFENAILFVSYRGIMQVYQNVVYGHCHRIDGEPYSAVAVSAAIGGIVVSQVLTPATASLDVERERRREAQAALTAAQERLRDASDADFLVAQLKHSYEAQVEELQREVQQLRCAARVPTNTSSGAFIGTPRAADASPASASKPSQSSRKSFEEYMREKPAYRLRR